MDFLRSNFNLFLIVFFVWLAAYGVYHFSLPDSSGYSKKVHKIVECAKIIVKGEGDITNEVGNMISEVENTYKDSFYREAGKHFSIALFVAGLLILAVEIHTKSELRREIEDYNEKIKKEIREYRDEVARDVWTAVSRTLVPKTISNEVEYIFKSQIIREECYYTITFHENYNGLPEDTIVLHRTLDCFIRNLTGDEGHPYTFSSTIISPFQNVEVELNGEKFTLPKHIICKINKKPVEVENCIDPENPFRFNYEIKLPKSDSIKTHLYHECEEICRIQDTNSYITGVCLKNLRIIINNQIPNKISVQDVNLHHPRPDELYNTQKNMWRYDGGVVPGQGFEISWKKI